MMPPLVAELRRHVAHSRPLLPFPRTSTAYLFFLLSCFDLESSRVNQN